MWQRRGAAFIKFWSKASRAYERFLDERVELIVDFYGVFQMDF